MIKTSGLHKTSTEFPMRLRFPKPASFSIFYLSAFIFPMRFLLALSLLTTLSFSQQPAAHDHTAAEIPGLKKELFAGITEADFMKLGDKPKTVKLTLIATFNAANYGMNFNGHAHGKAVFTVPTGWNVEVTFINPSPIPHSLLVVEKDMLKKPQMGAPYFDGAGVPKPEQGMAFAKADFTFTADEAGEYALACGFPAHAANGHWVAFNVSDEAKTPTLQLGEAPAKEIK
jgi:sulfocyanin